MGIEKKAIIVYGNCQASAIATLFQAAPELYENYDIIHHFVRMEDNHYHLWEEQINRAEIIFCQDVQDWPSYAFREKAERKKLIKFPFIYFAALWPFDATQNQPDHQALALKSKIPQSLNFDYEDSLLGKLRAQISDPEERYQAYRKLEYNRPININRYCNAEIVRLEKMDESFGLEIGNYIIKSFRTKRLFHTITHPTIDLFAQISREICRRADVACAFDFNSLEDWMSAYQVPVHPEVIKALGLEWLDSNTRYNHHGRKLTFEAYYRAYIHIYG